jgi:transposase-like protein
MVQEEGTIMVNRRKFTPEFKAQVVLELLSGAKSGAEACRQYQVNAQLLCRWKAEFLQNAPRVFNFEEQNSQEQARIAELERMVGRLTLALEIAKKASSMLSGNLGRSEGWR